MLKRLRKPQHQKFAEKAAREAAEDHVIGNFLGVIEEDSHLSSYRFEAKLKGYVGWEWVVVVYQSKKSALPTVSEVVLIPGKAAIVAPEWVPWSERRAELEKAKSLPASDLEEAEDSQPNPEDAGVEPPKRKRVRKSLIKKQVGDES